MPTIPPCFIADLVVSTPFSILRSRFYYSLTRDLEDEADVEAASEAIFQHIAPPLSVIMGENSKLLRIEGRYFGPAGSDIEGNSISGLIPGVMTAIAPGGLLDDGSETAGLTIADQMPDDVVLMVQIRTGQAGRSKRGRRFFSGIGERIQNSGKIVDDHYPSITTFANSLNSDVTNISLPTAGGAGTAHARHWDRKNNLLHPITKTYVLGCMMSRMDRRPKLLIERI